jgi:KR domain
MLDAPRPESKVTAAAAIALLRVAASEAAAPGWCAFARCTSAPPRPVLDRRPGTPQRGNALEQHGVWSGPRVARTAIAPAAFGHLSIQGSAIVTGGLGDLGRLVASWIAASGRSEVHVLLLGRTGRGGASPDRQTHASSREAALRVARCDIGSCEEADQAGWMGGDWPAMSALFQSGGVLQVIL